MKINKYECIGCGVCAETCPTSSILMKQNREGFFYPVINSEKCIECNKCKLNCPENKKHIYISKDKSVKAYAAHTVYDEVRKNSSSGGMFYMLAQEIINCNGIVYGARFIKDGTSVEHVGVETEDELKQLMGAKYVQSICWNVYKDIASNLKNHRKVLFVGTPCQIEALYAFLGSANLESLYTVDLICHGVPSNGIWKRYVRENFGYVPFASFRDKTYGWKRFSLKIIDNHGNEYVQCENENSYMRGFLNHLFCRNSCYKCRYKGIERNSDLTLGDFWRINQFLEELDDDKGISMVFVHSFKGKELLESIEKQNKIRTFIVDAQKAAKSNPMMQKSIKKHKNSKKFFELIEQYSIVESIEKCLHRSVIERAIGKIKWIVFRK